MSEGGCGCQFGDTKYFENSGWCGANVTLFMTMVDLMFRTNCRVADPCRRVADQPVRSYPTDYDFIVVGAGVAGSVVGSRLSENNKWRVLVLEAGPEEPSVTGVPALAVSAIGTTLDWGYKTEPQGKACLAKGGSCYWPRGKMVGGTGSMTGMMYTRGHKEIFNSWARNGNVGWTYKECLEYFKKSEKNKNIDLVDMPYHGTHGPLVVQQFPHHPKFAEDIIKAGEELGYRNGDLNGHNQTGFAIAQVMVDEGVRASTAKMYLRPAYKRKNLVVKINARVTKIVIDHLSKRASGVKYKTLDGEEITATAKKEIILCAGAVGSPHLLLLSGVGPRTDLVRLGIPVIRDLRVGHNLHNHVSVGLKFTINDTNKRVLTMETLQEYLKNGTGPIASTGLTQTTAFIHSKYSRHIPDLQLFFDGFSAGCSNSGGQTECSDGSLKENCGRREIFSRPTNVLTRSKGFLTLKSSDPMDPPLIYPNYLSEKHDVDVLVDGIKQVIKISQTEALKKWNMTLDTSPAKFCEDKKFGSDEYWECVVRMHTGPENHPAGSCKMGPAGDPEAVVDPELRLHGVVNLRVIDASVFPYIPNSNPIASIVMLAEKGSHMISSAWTLC